MKAILALSLLSVGVHAQFEFVGSNLNNAADQSFYLNGGTGANIIKGQTPAQCATTCHNAVSYVVDGETRICRGFNVNSKGNCILRFDISNPITTSGFTLYRLTGLATDAPVVVPTLKPSKSPTTDAPVVVPTLKPSKSPTVPPTEKPTIPPTNPTNKPTKAPETKRPTKSPTVKTTRRPTTPGKTERRCGAHGKINGVCGFTPVKAWDADTGMGDCYSMKVKYRRAAELCAEQGAGSRLCTAREVKNSVAMNTGCRLNREQIWTKSRGKCRNGVMVLPGDGKKWSYVWSGDYDANGEKVFVRDTKITPQCVNKYSQKKAYVRCCANDALFTSNDGVDYYEGLAGDF